MFAHPIVPRTHESLQGFVLRIAEKNFLTPLSVVSLTLGRVRRPPNYEDSIRLAEACQCGPGEITQLFGFEIRREDGLRCWRLGDEWITKKNFVAARSMALCPQCITEESYSPGVWDLSLYSTCAYHRIRLVSACPDCGRDLRWTRPSVGTCQCGQDLRLAPRIPGSDASWVLAQLIECRLDPVFPLNLPDSIARPIVDRLAVLTLDGLFKTIWFLGFYVAGFESLRWGHGLLRPKEVQANSITERAFAMLADWPEALDKRIREIARNKNAQLHDGPYFSNFRPLVAYLEQELDKPEFRFIHQAYEIYIRKLWKEAGQRYAPRRLSNQLELDL